MDYGTVGFPLRGCAVFVGTLNPVSGMTVEIFMGNGTRIASTTTDAKGEFSSPNLKEGAYSVEGTADHAFKTQSIFRTSKSSKSLLCLFAVPK